VGGCILRGRGNLRPRGALDGGAEVNCIADEGAHNERNGGNDLEVDQRLQSNSSDLAHIADLGHTGGNHQEDQRSDAQLDEIDESVG